MVVLHSLEVAVAGLAAAWLIVYLAHDLPIARTLLHAGEAPAAGAGTRRSRLSDARPLLLRALPMGFVVLLISLNVSVPRYAIEHWWNAHVLGVFAAMNYVFVAFGGVVIALAQAVTPRLARYHSERRPAEFRRLLLQSLGVGVAAGVGTVLGVALLGRPVLKLVYGPAFAGHLDVFLVLAVAGGLGYARTFLGHAVTAARWFAIQPLVAVSVLTTTVVLAWLLVPRGGMMGAALAVLGGSVVQTMGMGSVSLWVSRALSRASIAQPRPEAS